MENRFGDLEEQIPNLRKEVLEATNFARSNLQQVESCRNLLNSSAKDFRKEQNEFFQRARETMQIALQKAAEVARPIQKPSNTPEE